MPGPVRRAEIGDRIWPTVHACLAKRPEDRPTVGELAAHFSRLLGRTGELPADAPPPVPPRPPLEVREPVAPPAAGPVAEVLATGGATVPVPDAPAEVPATRRRRRWPLIAPVALLPAAEGIGAWYGRPPATPGASQTSQGPTLRWYSVPAVVTSPSRGMNGRPTTDKP